MIGKMEERAIRDRFMGMMSVGSMFEIKGLWVCRGGEDVASRYHLQFNDDTEVEEISTIFPEIPFSLYSCVDVAMRKIGPGCFFGECFVVLFRLIFLFMVVC